jgi:hypothetical protein
VAFAREKLAGCGGRPFRQARPIAVSNAPAKDVAFAGEKPAKTQVD